MDMLPREAQSISSLQGEADEDQVEYGPSDLSAQSDAYMAAVASQIALLGGGPDAVTPRRFTRDRPEPHLREGPLQEARAGKCDLRQQTQWESL